MIFNFHHSLNEENYVALKVKNKGRTIRISNPVEWKYFEY